MMRATLVVTQSMVWPRWSFSGRAHRFVWQSVHKTYEFAPILKYMKDRCEFVCLLNAGAVTGGR